MADTPDQTLAGQIDSPALPDEPLGADRVEIHHKSHPVHGWRDLLKEVGVIVLGILIALGLEQAVAWAHDRSVAREAQASLRSEITANLRAVARRETIEPCIQHRLREITGYLDAASQSEAPSPPSWIGAPFNLLTKHTALQAAQSAGRFVLLGETEKDNAAILYADFDDFNEAGIREWYAWAQLRSLTGIRGHLSDADVARLRSAVQEARAADWFIRIDDAEIADYALRMRISMPRLLASQKYQSASVCLAMNTPYAEAAARAGGARVPFPE